MAENPREDQGGAGGEPGDEAARGGNEENRLLDVGAESPGAVAGSVSGSESGGDRKSDDDGPGRNIESVRPGAAAPPAYSGLAAPAWTSPYPQRPGYPGSRPVFGDSWPEPADSRAMTGLLAALIGGAGAAVFLPFGEPGIGWPLLGITIVAALSLINGSRRIEWDRLGWGVAGLALLSVCALRAAGWLAALCVLTAIVAFMLAIAGGRSVQQLLMAAIAVPAGAFRAVPWLSRGSREIRGRTGVLRLVISIGVGVVLLVIFGALLAGADDRFADLISAITPRFTAETFVRWTLVFGFFAFLTLGAAFTVASPPRLTDSTTEVRSLRRLEWAIPVGMLVVLFAMFVAVQSTPMFGAVDAQVRTPGELTYATHARSGFWQLSLVTILTLAIIGAAARWAPKESTEDRRLLRVLAVALAGLTLLIVASALHRMWAYQNAYGFTVLRLLVMSCELWLGVVYALVIAALVRLRAEWLPTAVIGTAMVALLSLAAVNPEGLIAERNISRFTSTGRLDIHYLTTLSRDAFPALAALPEEQRRLVLERRFDERSTDWRSWNLSRDR